MRKLWQLSNFKHESKNFTYICVCYLTAYFSVSLSPHHYHYFFLFFWLHTIHRLSPYLMIKVNTRNNLETTDEKRRSV